MVNSERISTDKHLNNGIAHERTLHQHLSLKATGLPTTKAPALTSLSSPPPDRPHEVGVDGRAPLQGGVDTCSFQRPRDTEEIFCGLVCCRPYVADTDDERLDYYAFIWPLYSGSLSEFFVAIDPLLILVGLGQRNITLPINSHVAYYYVVPFGDREA